LRTIVRALEIRDKVRGSDDGIGGAAPVQNCHLIAIYWGLKHMRLRTVLAALLAASFSLIGTTRSDDKATRSKSVEGHWEGQVVITPQIALKITLDVATAKDGSLSGKWGSPDQGASGLPLEGLKFADGTLSFSAKAAGASFKGKMNDDGTELLGEWSQAGKAFVLNLKRVDPSKAVAAPIPKELAGIWEGKLDAGAGIAIRLALKVEKDKDGALKATLASPDQGANNIPISAIGLKDGVLTFDSKVIGAKFTGKKNGQGTGFEGEFEQLGRRLPLKLLKTDKLSEIRRPQTPKPPFPYRAENVTYTNKTGGVTLAGTLSIPPGQGPFPAVILITGSGAQDRDESILGHQPFLLLADYLTRRGIAVLRVDDRGIGGSTGSTSTSTSEDFATDVLAGLEFLKNRTEIDGKRLGLIGHSEGGIIAPMVASRSKNVAFIVLMAGTGIPGSEIIAAQGELIQKASGSSESEIKHESEVRKRLVDIIAHEKDEKVARDKLAKAWKEILAAMPDSERKALSKTQGETSGAIIDAFNTPWFRFFLTFDPRPTLRRVHCPVLALNGGKDLQVPPKENLAEIKKALVAGGNSKVKTVEFPGLNHLFQPCKTGAPSEYAAIETTIAPEALKTIGDWIADVTGTRAGSAN
jgi:pimeloyl-ACP methyl ester carboxylesterase